MISDCLKNQRCISILRLRLLQIRDIRGFKKYTPILFCRRKNQKKRVLTKEDKRQNRQIASFRVLNENVIGRIKRFKIVSDRYRNRRKRFGLRFNLIAGIYNWEMKN